jgi:hypothetical protein
MHKKIKMARKCWHNSCHLYFFVFGEPTQREEADLSAYSSGMAELIQ